MYTINLLQPEDEAQAWMHNHFDDFADADAWAHQLHQDTKKDVGLWLNEGEGPFLYAIVHDGWTYIRYE